MGTGVGTQYEVALDSQGYFIQKDTYSKQLQQPYLDQTIDHEPTVSDFSFWKYYLQSSWEGGYDNDILIEPDMFKDSSNIDIFLKPGQFQLGQLMSADQAAGVISTEITNFQQYAAKFYAAAKRYVYVSTDGITFASSKDLGSGKAASDMIEHGGKLWVAIGADGYYSFDGSNWASVATNFTPDYLCNWWNGNTETMVGTDTNVLKSTVDAGANWTTIKTFSATQSVYLKKPCVFKKKVFFFTSNGATSNAPCTLYVYDGLNVADIWTTQHDVSDSMCVYGNKLWWAIKTQNHVTIYSFDGNVITPEFQLNDASLDVPIYMIVWDDKLVVTFKDTAASSNHSIAYDGDKWGKLTYLSTSANISCSLGVFNKILFYGTSAGNIYKLGTTFATSGTLDSSEIDMNLMNIDKLGLDIVVNFDKLPTNTSVAAYYQIDNSGSWVQAGATYATANGIRGVFPLTANLKFKKIQYRITLTSSDSAATPKVKDVMIRYVPMPDVRYKWGMNVLAINSIRKLNAVLETSTGAQIMAALHSSKEKQQVLNFEDVDYFETTLSSAHTISATVLSAYSTTGAPAKGRLRCESEEILYTSVSGLNFLGCTRGARGTEAAAHADSVALTNLYKVLIQDYKKAQAYGIDQTAGLESIVGLSLIEV